MAFFGLNKKKKTNDPAERAERIERKYINFKAQLMKLERMKKEKVEYIAEAKCNGHSAKVAYGKQDLTNIMKQEKQVNGMLAMIEHAQTQRELSMLTNDFINCMTDISDDIIDTGTANYKKAEKKLLRANYQQKRQQDALDEMLSVGDVAYNMNTQGKSSEFDDEIDRLVNSAVEERGGIPEDKYTNKH